MRFVWNVSMSPVGRGVWQNNTLQMCVGKKQREWGVEHNVLQCPTQCVPMCVIEHNACELACASCSCIAGCATTSSEPAGCQGPLCIPSQALLWRRTGRVDNIP